MMTALGDSDDDSLMEDEIKESPWSLRRIVVLISLCIVYALDCGNITFLNPFFPTEAEERGVLDSWTGIIFGCYPLVVVLFAPLCGWLIPKCGVRKILFSGLLICGVALFLSGVCDLLQDALAFLTLSLSLRFLAAVGAAASETATLAIALNEFPNSLGTAMGVLETFAGVGFAVGPAAGGFLFTAGGFRLPFFFLGSMMIAVIPILVYVLRKKQDEEYADEGEEENSTMIQFFKIPGVIIISLCYITIYGLFGFVSPILAPHLKDRFAMNASRIGLFFFTAAAFYGAFSSVAGWIVDRMHCYHCMIVLGFVGDGLAFLLLGPAPFLSFILPAREIWTVWVAMSLIGIFGAIAFVVLLPELKRIVTDHGIADNASTNGIISGIFASMTNLGGFIGPILGGILYEGVGFQWATAIEGFICIGQALLVVAFVAGEKLVRRKTYTGLLKGEKQALLE